MESAAEFHAMQAALAWQIELGATECIGEHPINRFEAPKPAPKPASAAPPAATPAKPAQLADPALDPVAEARAAAKAAPDLAALEAALAAYPHCELKRGARNLVFADGRPGARVMIVGEAPGAEEDKQGKPFVGRAGQLLDRMLAAIGLGRDGPDAKTCVYITNVLPWRPPQNRDPSPDEVAMLRPFVERHIELAAPDMLLLAGNHACNALLGRKGITRLRGTWTEACGLPALPVFHPAYLLRTPAAKREAWADLLDIQARLKGTP